MISYSQAERESRKRSEKANNVKRTGLRGVLYDMYVALLRALRCMGGPMGGGGH